MLEILEMFAGLFRRKTPAEKLDKQINREIYGRLFPHLNAEQDQGYPFVNYPDLVAHTETIDVQAALERAERQIRELPEAYGKCFRYAMHRDICEQLRAYTALANCRTEPNIYWKPASATA
ncbi:MAG: hypothetical protein KIS67_28580 [Verrucomicrobiae bacterium]|nr:hypothetical protein [Verrucomicrobiae bacterium]